LGFEHAYMPIEFIQGYERGRVYRDASVQPGQKAFGDAVLSRFPIVSADVKVLSFLPPPEDPWKQYRGAIRASIQVGDRHVNFVTCHLGASDVERRVQCREVIDFAAETRGANIVTGDFNTYPTFDYYSELTKKGFTDGWVEKGSGDGFTMRPERPFKRIDYILYQPAGGIRLKNIHVGDHGVSDHMSLIGDFEFV
jgi:endonuclease/exonuclease/phosphatase family metal-dependent hydrolase